MFKHFVEVVVSSDVTAHLRKVDPPFRSWNASLCVELAFLYQALQAEAQDEKLVGLPVKRLHLDGQGRHITERCLVFTCVDLVASLALFLGLVVLGEDLVELVPLLAHLTPRHHVVGNIEDDDLPLVLHVVRVESKQLVFICSEGNQLEQFVG